MRCGLLGADGSPADSPMPGAYVPVAAPGKEAAKRRLRSADCLGPHRDLLWKCGDLAVTGEQGPRRAHLLGADGSGAVATALILQQGRPARYPVRLLDADGFTALMHIC